MPNPHKLLRSELKTQVNTDKSGYVLTDLQLGETFFPKAKLEDLGTKPYIWFVIPCPGTRNRVLRNKSSAVQLPIQVAIQYRTTDDATIETLLDLIDQIQNSCENDFTETSGGTTYNFTWNNTEPLKDDNGLAYSYEQLTTLGVFQSILNFTFDYIKAK